MWLPFDDDRFFNGVRNNRCCNACPVRSKGNSGFHTLFRQGRHAIKAAAADKAVAAMIALFFVGALAQNLPLPPLPYDYNALEPYIDQETMKIHHLKHHQTYTDKLNGALAEMRGSDKFKHLAKLGVDALLQPIDADSKHADHRGQEWLYLGTALVLRRPNRTAGTAERQWQSANATGSTSRSTELPPLSRPVTLG